MNILSIREIIIPVFEAVVNWFYRIFSSVDGALNFLLAGFFIYTVVRLFLMPLIGNAGSDISKFAGYRKNSNKNSNKKSNKNSNSHNNKEAKES